MDLRRIAALLAFVIACGGLPAAHAQREAPGDSASIAVSEMPQEARATVSLIRKGGPFPYPRDGIVFANRERQLPSHKRGYYHEYTVPTPGERSRGARRIVAGDGGELWYSDDHYAHFRRVRE